MGEGDKDSSKLPSSARYTVYIQNSNAFKKLNPSSKFTVLYKIRKKESEVISRLGSILSCESLLHHLQMHLLHNTKMSFHRQKKSYITSFFKFNIPLRKWLISSRERKPVNNVLIPVFIYEVTF